MVKTEIEENYGYWECGDNLILPSSIREGSLAEAYEMMGVFEDDLTVEFLSGRQATWCFQGQVWPR